MIKSKIVSNHTPSSVLVTGGCGFIGSNFVRFLLLLKNPPQVINYDLLTYAGNIGSLDDCRYNKNHIFVKGDICDSTFVSQVFEKYKPDTVVNFAAESHVDRSIDSPMVFFETNVKGTLNLLESSLNYGVERYLQVSTDEVYGSLSDEGLFTEESQMAPNSPYSASKASADNFVRAYNHTYGLKTIITRCSNNYGPYQYPEKLIPLVISFANQNKKIPIYGDGKNIRDWLHVNDHCIGIWSALTCGKSGEVYNFGGNCEFSNIEIVKTILKSLGKSESLIEFVTDRLGHDYRYAIDASKAKKELQWSPVIDFEAGIEQTIKWYLQNSDWLDSVASAK